MSRAAAPALRMGSQDERTLELPPVPCMPNAGLKYSLAAGANSVRIFLCRRSCRTSHFHGLHGQRLFLALIRAAVCSLRGSALQLRGEVDRLTNPLIRPAAADIALHRVINVRIAWLRIGCQKRGGGHDLS